MNLETFQMIDRVEALDVAANRIRCLAVVPERSSILDHHFPGNPILPGVFMIETMAQCAGYLVLAVNGFSRMPFLARVDGAKLRRFVEPRTSLTVSASLDHEGSGFVVAEGSIAVDGKEIASTALRFRTIPFPSDEARQMLLDAATAVGIATDRQNQEAAVDA